MPIRFLPWIYLSVIATVPVSVACFRFCPETGLTSLLRFGSNYEHLRSEELRAQPRHVIPNHYGYDAQFYAEIALNLPKLEKERLENSCDLASYRVRRILMPALAALLGWGQPGIVLNVYAALNLVAWLTLAAIAWHLLPPVSWTNGARFAALLLAAGNLESLRASLPDLPALTLILGAVLLNRRGRPWSATVLLALAGLCKETSVLAAVLFWPNPGSDARTWMKAALHAALGIAPTVLWWVFLRAHFGPGPEGMVNFTWPLAGWLDVAHRGLNALAEGTTDSGRWIFFWFASLSVAFQLALFWSVLPKTNLFWRASLGFALLLPLLGEPVWSGYWAILRNILPLTAACILLAPPGRWLLPFLVLISIPSLHALFRLAF
ncbi:MAG: hypothetical protein OHK005_17640 [Candidatus Methylacidiphilales bacterium]